MNKIIDTENEYNNEGKYLINFDMEQKKIIKAQYFPRNTTPEEMQYCINVAKSLGLNPLLNEIYFVERKFNINGQWSSKISPLAGRNAYRKIALNSGQLESINVYTELKDTPKLTNGEWGESKDLVAICEIKKTNKSIPFRVEIEYGEYVQRKKDGTPTSFWKDKPKTMLKKVAESQCLKMAFDVGGLYDENEVQITKEQGSEQDNHSADYSDIDLNTMLIDKRTGEIVKQPSEQDTQSLLSLESMETA